MRSKPKAQLQIYYGGDTEVDLYFMSLNEHLTANNPLPVL